MNIENIEDEEIKETLARSGYFLETRVLNTLHDKRYVNIPNITYQDKITGKSRELDVYSESERITENLKLNHPLHIELQHQLIIECVNNLQPVVFFKRPDKNSYTIFNKFKYSKTEREIVNRNGGKSADWIFHDFTTSSKNFHLNKYPSSSQYCSFTQKKTKEKEWMASHPDGLHDTFNKLFDYSHYKIKNYEEWMPTSAWKNDVFVVFLFPVLILQNKLYEAYELEGKVQLEDKKHIIYEFNRFTDHSESILIDVISEDYLGEYLDLIKADILNLKSVYVKYYESKKIKAPNNA